MADNTLHINSQGFDAAIASGVTLVDFWATWCGPCRMIAPIIDQLATENAGKAAVAKLDVDESPDIAQRFGVFTIPTLIIFKNGQEKARMVGARPKAELQKQIDALL